MLTQDELTWDEGDERGVPLRRSAPVGKIAVGVAITAVVGIGLASAWAGPNDEPSGAVSGPALEASTNDAAPGDTIVVHGSGCIDRSDAPRGVTVWLIPAPGTVPFDPVLSEPVGAPVPDADGAWTLDIVAPNPTTEYSLEAACLAPAGETGGPRDGFVYSHQRIVIAD